MSAFVVTEVGKPESARQVEAANDYHAVAEVAGCAVKDVPIHIWEERRQHPWHPRRARCYMPRDNSGRQWVVEDATTRSSS
jgi:hypothetical protein